jgi:outer membrane lipoprotein-sorting protein
MRWLVLIALLTARTAVAQPSPPTADEVLANVEHYYDGASDLTATFRQTVWSASFNTTATAAGALWLEQPSSYRFDYLGQRAHRAVVTRTVVSDGGSSWNIDHELKAVVETTDGIPEGVSFFFQPTLAADFNVAFGQAKGSAPGNLVLELTPKYRSPTMVKLLLIVSPVDWHVVESVVVDGRGNTNRFRFIEPTLTTPTKPSWFQVNPASVRNYRTLRHPTP